MPGGWKTLPFVALLDQGTLPTLLPWVLPPAEGGLPSLSARCGHFPQYYCPCTSSTSALSVGLAATHAPFFTTLCFQHFSTSSTLCLDPTVNLTKAVSGNHATTRMPAVVKFPLPKNLGLDFLAQLH